ncbi:MAG: TolC family protein [Kiritimatiellae bacterium]|nr:TolC family protein [Kiritimatiellia bacterium]
MNILTKQSLFMALLAAGILCGCRSYEPKPIDWNEEANAGVTNEVRIASLDDAVTLALIGNRELNALRLKSANSAKAAKESGWWEDPELDFDLMRIINPSEHPFLGGASIAFTIPLSGATAIAAKADELYAQADIAEIKAAERDTGAEVRHAAIRLAALRRRAALLSEHDSDERIVRARENVGKLHEAGEVSASELAGVQRQKHIRHHALMETEREIAETEIAFLRILGLRPGTKISLTLPLRVRPSMPSDADDPLELVRHPMVEAALARLGGTEKSLEAEIRRQYPDLKLGPAYANEEGLDRFGLVAGISIPLWNRNRKGIAEAEGARDEARLAAIDMWRSLVCDAATARVHLSNLLMHPPVPANEREQTDKLADAGELTPLDYLAVREQIFDLRLDELNWRRDVALAAAELQRFKIDR